ncbi:DUF6086 family protein, partial [Streptomyces lavendulae]|uniref:DUF6086 family protein n=1 Tax=Streptomyces lavendulae TaxID=1914 RepID=UPI003690E65E
MSQYYNMGDEVLWNPATGVSRLFLAQVAAFERELGIPSGIGHMEADDSEVDPVGLARFAEELVGRYLRGSHPVAAALSEGFTAVVAGLAAYSRIPHVEGEGVRAGREGVLVSG